MLRSIPVRTVAILLATPPAGRYPAVVIVWILFACAPCPPLERAPPSTPVLCSDVYDPDRIFHIDLTLSPEVWAALQDEHQNWEARLLAGLPLKPWHPIERFEADGERITDASIRLKGNPCCSWTSDKLQFVIAFDREDPDGRFKGLRKLYLDAPPYDPSLLRERVALSYFHDAGLAASCANHATVTIDGRYYGIYTNIEAVDREFLERQFPDAEQFGTLYKWDYDERRFEQRNHRDHPADDLDGYLAIDTVDAMEAALDTEQAYRFWAAEAVINQPDGYWSGSINWFLYHHPDRGWQYFPWDLDHAITWWSPLKSPFNRTDFHGQAPLVDLLWSTPEGRMRFVEAVDAMHRHHLVEQLQERTRRWAEQIRPYVEREPHRAGTVDDFDAEVERIVEHLGLRHGYLCRFSLET